LVGVRIVSVDEYDFGYEPPSRSALKLNDDV
jgi:hypothetical protein